MPDRTLRELMDPDDLAHPDYDQWRRREEDDNSGDALLDRERDREDEERREHADAT